MLKDPNKCNGQRAQFSTTVQMDSDYLLTNLDI